MLTLIKLVGMVITVMGAIFILKPQTMKQFIAFMGKGKRLYGVGILRLSFAVIFLLGASQCRLVGFITVMGVLFLVGGVTIFALRLDKLRSMLEWWSKKSLMVVRCWAVVAIALGPVIIYSV